MNCTECNTSEVTNCRVVDNVRYRIRQCKCGKKTFTQEVEVEKLPVGFWRKPGQKPKPKKKPKKKVTNKSKKKEKPMISDVKIKINENSPDWLVRIAAQLN